MNSCTKNVRGLFRGYLEAHTEPVSIKNHPCHAEKIHGFRRSNHNKGGRKSLASGAFFTTRLGLGHSGRLWSWTIQGFEPKPPYDGSSSHAGFEPYGVGYVELEGGLKVESRLTVADPARLHRHRERKLCFAQIAKKKNARSAARLQYSLKK